MRDVEELRALALPLRQRSCATCAKPARPPPPLGRDLGENSGIMSYHLRLLAEHDFVREVSGRGQGRERWWEVSPEPMWIARRVSVSRRRPRVRAAPAEPGRGPGGLRSAYEQHEMPWATWEAAGVLGSATRTAHAHRSRMQATRRRRQDLIGHSRREAADAPAGARTVVFGFLAYPEPAPGEAPGGPDEPSAEGD